MNLPPQKQQHQVFKLSSLLSHTKTYGFIPLFHPSSLQNFLISKIMSNPVGHPVCWGKLPSGCSRNEEHETAGQRALSEFLISHVFRSEEDATSIWKSKDRANAMVAELCQILEPPKNRADDDLTLPLYSPHSFSINDDEEHSDTDDANEEDVNYVFVDGLEYELEEEDDTSDHGQGVYGTETSTPHLAKGPVTLAIWRVWCRGLGPGAQRSSKGGTELP
jgi:hypothetical protein